jgi:hypothetical protein
MTGFMDFLLTVCDAYTCKLTKLRFLICIIRYNRQPRTQGLTYGKDPGWGWSRDFTKIDWIRGEGRVSNCMLPQKMLHFNYKE